MKTLNLLLVIFAVLFTANMNAQTDTSMSISSSLCISKTTNIRRPISYLDNNGIVSITYSIIDGSTGDVIVTFEGTEKLKKDLKNLTEKYEALSQINEQLELVLKKENKKNTKFFIFIIILVICHFITYYKMSRLKRNKK